MKTTKKTSINRRLWVLLLVCLVPLIIVMAYGLYMISRVSQRYETSVDHITRVNQFNLSFKEDLDYIMYIVTVNSDRASKLVDTDKPYQMIADARETFQDLRDHTENAERKSKLSGMIKSLNTLEKRVTEIMESASVVGKYDDNMSRLDLDIRVLTELIQEDIQGYIAEEVDDLNALKTKIRTEVRRTLAGSALFLLVVLLLAVLSSRKIMRNITKGISEIQEVTRKAGKGDFSSRLAVEEMDVELAELGEGYNQMVERLDALVKDIKDEQMNLRLTEQKLLQSQITPHFLYNTLDNIIWLAESGEKEPVIMMVTALSDFFRTTLSKGRDFISIKEEESHIHSYLKIQQFRYQDILNYEIDIPKELYQYQILKLTLQPLIENALYHGIKNKRGMGHIAVTGRKEGEILSFTVTDNGIGMKPEQLEFVKQEMEQERVNKKSFGLYNVNERIRLNYGSGYGVTIRSIYGEETVVTVRIPAREAETV